MENAIVLNTSININAPKAKVWDALVNPEIIKQYLFSTEAVSDWKIGSPLIFKGIWDGKSYEDKGIILALEPEKLLKYSYFSSMSGKEDVPENYANVTYELVENGDSTTFMLSQDGIKSEEAREKSEKDWQWILNELKVLMEK